MYPVQAILVTCCERHKESTHLLGILFTRCWLLAAKDIWNQHIYEVSSLGDVGVLVPTDIRNQHFYQVSSLSDVGYLLPKTYGINPSIKYPVLAMLVTCCQRHQESTHLLGILFKQCWLLAAKDIMNQHICQISCLGDAGFLLPKT